MTTTAFSAVVMGASPASGVEQTGAADANIIQGPQKWDGGISPGLAQKIKDKQTADILIATTDVAALYNFVKDYRYKGLIGPNARSGELAIIRLRVDAGIIPDINDMPGVLGVYDTAEPLPDSIVRDDFRQSAPVDGNHPSSNSSTIEHMADKAWGLGYTGEGVRIATMGSGVDFGHYDLNGQQARVPKMAEKRNDLLIKSTDGNESGKPFLLSFYPVVSSSVVLNTYNSEKNSYGDVNASSYQIDANNGLITFNTNMSKGLMITANYTYESPYADWPMAFDPISMSSYLSSGGTASGWYVDTSNTDLHNYHPVVIDGVNDFWNERDPLGGSSSVYSINETTDLRGEDRLNDINDPAFDLGNLYISTDRDNFYFGFERQPSLTNMSYGIYIDTAAGGAHRDPEANAIQADTSHSPEYAIYIPHIGVRWGVTASGAMWSENDTVAEPRFYEWNTTKMSWQSAKSLTTLGTMVVGEHVITGDNTMNDTFARLANKNISSSTFKLYINETPFPSDGYTVDWETGEITFSSYVPYLAEVTADYDYSADVKNAGDFASSAGFMECRLPKNLLKNPSSLNMEVFTVGNNQSHAQDTVPADATVDYSAPDWNPSISTTLSSFAYRNSTPISYKIGGIQSKSGVYHIGCHPDQNLAVDFYGRPVAMLLVDEIEAGVYDTVYVDLDNDKDFSDEKPASLFGAYKASEGISPATGAKLYHNFTLEMDNSFYPLHTADIQSFSSYQELLVGDGSAKNGHFNDTNIIKGTEQVSEVFRGITKDFSNDSLVYNTTGSEQTDENGNFSIYLPYRNIANETYLRFYYTKNPQWVDSYYTYRINNLTGRVTVNGPTIAGVNIYAWFKYHPTIDLSSPANYTINEDTGDITMSDAPPPAAVIYTTAYDCYKLNSTLYDDTSSSAPLAFIRKDGTDVLLEVRNETIYKDVDREGMKGDGNVSYQDLSGGMVYFISHADKGNDTFTASKGQTRFNLTHGGINPVSVFVYLNGSLLSGDSYSLDTGSRIENGFIILKNAVYEGSIISAVYEYNALPVPYSDVMSERSGVSNPLPVNGNLVCLFGDFSLDSAKGTKVASDIAAVGKGKDGAGNTLVKGMAPGAKLIAIRGGDPFNGWYFGAEGYDGVIGSGDEAEIIANTFSYAIPQSGWDLYSRFADYIISDYSHGTTAIVSGAGSSFSYGYGTIAAPGAGHDVITVGVSTDFHYRNYNPKAPIDLMRRYGDGGPNAQDGEVLPSSARGPTMTGNPKPDIVASGSFCYGDTPLNVDQNKYSGAWEWEGGQWAWDLWSGDALSSAITSGGLALVYQAYYEAHGEYPDAYTAKSLLKSGAENMNYDVFSQGAGVLNVYNSCLLAHKDDGVMVDKTEWTPGSFHGNSYSNFVNLATPGETYTQSFNITNYNSTYADMSVSGEIFKKFSEASVKMDMNKYYDDRNTPGIINLQPYIPAKTEFMRVTATVPYSDGYTNMGELFDWTDNGDGSLDFPAEQNRIEYCINSNILQLNIRDPLSKVHTGLAIQIKGFGGNAVHDPWTIKMEFFEKSSWDWISTTPSSFTLAPGETMEVNATISVPADAPAGIYEGGIYVSQRLLDRTVAVGDGYVMNYSDMWAVGWYNSYSVNNSVVTRGDAVILPGSSYFTFIPYHEVFDAPAENTTIQIKNTTESKYVLWHTVNSTVSGVTGDKPGSVGHISDWHIMNESARPGKYNYTIDMATHTVKLSGWHLNKGERVTIYFLNGSYNLTQGKKQAGTSTIIGGDFDYTSKGFYSQITLSQGILDKLNNTNSTLVASYCWSRIGGTYKGMLKRAVVPGSVTLYNGGEVWSQYADIAGEKVITANGGETETGLAHGNILLGSATLYLNDTPIDNSEIRISESLTASASGGEKYFNLSHGNIISSLTSLYYNNRGLKQLAEISALHPEKCFNASSTAVIKEDVGATAVNKSGEWFINTQHSLLNDMRAIKPGSYILYKDGSPLTAGTDFKALKNESDGLLNGEFEIFNYDSGASYTMDYSYYNPYITSGYLAHGNVIDDSYKIYKNGFKMQVMDYDLNLTTGKITLHDALEADDSITAVYSYNTYLVSVDGRLELTDPMNAGDSLSINYSYTPYLLTLSSGKITLADPLEPGNIISADYSYAVFHTDVVNGFVKLDNWLYPGRVITADYSVYNSVIPVCVNVPLKFGDVHFGGGNGTVQDMYNNTALYGGSDSRFYFMDVPTTGLYQDPGNRQFVIDTKWLSGGTDIDTTVYSKSRQTSYPGVSFDSGSVGLYSVKKSGGSTATSGVFTTTGGPEEILFSPMKNGLNILQLHGTIMNGSESYEAFNGTLGLIDISDLEMDIKTNSLTGKQSVSTTASMDRYGISGAAAGPASPKSYPNEVIYQDDPDWSHYDTFIDQLLSGRYTRAVEVSDSALIFDVHITSKECPDLDLAVFLDGDSNGDHVVNDKDNPSYLDGKPEKNEFVAMCADADADEEVTLVTPAPGTYLIRVYGFDVPGGKNTFNLDITLVQGTGFKVSGEDSSIIPAYQPKDLNITWNFDESSPDGTFMGAFYIGTYNAPMSMLLPVSLTLERTAPSVTKMTPEPAETVNTATPTISVSYDDLSSNTGQQLTTRTHVGPAHLWGSSSDEWKVTKTRTEVPGVGMDASRTRMYLDDEDVTDEIISTSTVARYTPSAELPDGLHTVRVVIGDAVGNEMQKTWSFAIDTAVPVISGSDTSSAVFIEGLNGSGSLNGGENIGEVYTTNATYTLKGHAELGCTVQVNGKDVVILPDGSFSVELNLTEGINSITIVATDPTGNRNVREFSVIKDTKKPNLSVSLSGSRISSNPVAKIAGSIDLISELGKVSVTINGIPVILYADGTFSMALALNEGENIITVVATDAAGNTATKEVRITLDRNAPSLSVDSIPDTVSTKQLNISGVVESGSRVYINGKQVITNSITGAFSTQVSLSPGHNLITVSATDLAGNSVEYSFVIDYRPEDSISALTASTTSQSAPMMSATGAMLLVLVAAIFLILGFIASRFMKGGKEEGGAVIEAPQEIPPEEETEEVIPEEAEEVFEDGIEIPEEAAEAEEIEEEPEDISDEIIEESIAEESPEEEGEPQEQTEEDVDFQPAKPEISLEEAKSLLSTGDMVGAMEIYDNLLEQDPGNVKALIGKAKALNATGKWGRALQSISEALKLDANNPDALVLKGDIFAEQGKREMARQAYEQALHIDPTNSEIAAKIQKL